MTRLHCETFGEGPAVAMVHGWGLHGGVWRELATALAPHACVQLPDLPGHGRSHDAVPAAIANWSHAVAESLDARPAIWIGWSLGALVALHAATRVPESVRALVLIAATPRFTRSPDWPHAMATEMLAQFADELDTDYTRTLSRFIALQFGSSNAEREAARQLRQELAARPPTLAGLRAGLAILAHADLRRELAGIHVPVLVVNGERDRLVSMKAGETIASQVRQGHCRVIAAAGHAPFLSHGSEVQDHILKFINAHH